MTVTIAPGRRAWIETVAPLWADKAAALRRIERVADAGAAARADALEYIVAGLRAEIAAAPEQSPSPEPHAQAAERADALAEAMETLRVCQPYFHPEWQIMVGNTHFLDRPRESAARKIEALGGTIPEGWIIYWVEEEKALPPPPPEPVPFTAGPQMDMFA